ncbi:hemopexin repeat-containing protein [Cellulomonas sp. P5_C6]
MSRGMCAIALPNGKAYLFQDGTYTRLDFLSGLPEQNDLPMTNWPGLRPEVADAAVYYGFGKAYFFYGDEYVRYETGSNGPEGVEADYLPPHTPFTTSQYWPGVDAAQIDAVLNWGTGKLYFFCGPDYLRYDITLDRVDDNYPRPIAGAWQGLWDDGVDAALYQGGTYAYFFKGSEYRRYNVDTDAVDGQGSIGTLQLEPVPAAMLTAARDLTLPEANTVMGYLIQAGKVALRAASTPYSGDWQTGIATPQPATHVVVQPTTLGGIAYQYVGGAQTLIDNVDQRMLVALYRLTRWLNSSPPDVSAILHMGIGHGSGTPNDCHNQGRALDFGGVQGTLDGVAFDKRVLADWGNRPVVAGSAERLDPAVDALANLLFRTALCFATFECECNGIGPANKWPRTRIGDLGGYVIHPDYVDGPGGTLRSHHQDHIHMQVGKTRI